MGEKDAIYRPGRHSRLGPIRALTHRASSVLLYFRIQLGCRRRHLLHETPKSQKGDIPLKNYATPGPQGDRMPIQSWPGNLPIARRYRAQSQYGGTRRRF